MLNNPKKAFWLFAAIQLGLSLLILPWPKLYSSETSASSQSDSMIQIHSMVKVNDSLLNQVLQSALTSDSSKTAQLDSNLNFFSTQKAEVSRTKSRPVFSIPSGYTLAGRVGDKGVFIKSPTGQKTWLEKGKSYQDWHLFKITEKAAFLRKGSQIWEVNW